MCEALTLERIDTAVTCEEGGCAPKEPPVVRDADRYLMRFGGGSCGAAGTRSAVEHGVAADNATVDFVQPHLVAELCREMHFAPPDDARVRLEEADHLLGRGHGLAPQYAAQYAAPGLGDDP